MSELLQAAALLDRLERLADILPDGYQRRMADLYAADIDGWLFCVGEYGQENTRPFAQTVASTFRKY